MTMSNNNVRTQQSIQRRKHHHRLVQQESTRIYTRRLLSTIVISMCCLGSFLNDNCHISDTFRHRILLLPTVAADSKPIRLSRSIHYQWAHHRGGARSASTNDDEEVEEEEGEEVESEENNLEEINDEEDGQNSSTQRTTFSSLSTPFRMYSDVQEEAQTVRKNNDDEGIERNSTSNEDENSSEESSDSTRSLLVGGGDAATLVKPKPSKRKKKAVTPEADRATSGGNTVMAPMDTSRVAPLSSRLIQEADSGFIEGGIEEGEDVSYPLPEPSPEQMSNVAKLWWVNVWTQQLSDIDEGKNESLTDVLSQEDASNVTNTENATMDESVSNATSEETLGIETDVQEEQTVEVSIETTEEDHDIEGNVTEVDESIEEVLEEPLELPQSSESVVVTTEAPSYVSSGMWVYVDNILSGGLASRYDSWKVSRALRRPRKLIARVTGLHGFLSRKPTNITTSMHAGIGVREEEEEESEGKMDDIRNRIAAIDRAREGVERAIEADIVVPRRRGFLGIGGRRVREDRQEEKETGQKDSGDDAEIESLTDEEERQRQLQKEVEEKAANATALLQKIAAEEAMEEKRRMERVKQIDKLMAEGQERLLELACEKDVLQRRPNPLWNYTTETASTEQEKISEEEGTNSTVDLGIQASRKFSFPPQDLVEEYLDMIFSSRRLTKMNHTYLWKNSEMTVDDEDETIGDDLLTPSADAHKLYKRNEPNQPKPKNGGGGSWLLRQRIAGGRTLGEKIGEAAETAAYKAVCAAVMSFLARSIGSIHGVNIMEHSDIRLVLEQAPDLPPVGEGVIPGSSGNYAQETIKTVMRRKAKKNKKRSKQREAEDRFVQREAVTEMLLSHCQISAPLLKLFPLAWQRAFLGNIISLATAVMSDFFDGLQFQILGHQLSFSFAPITEADVINHLRLGHRRSRPEEFEAAVHATAADVSENLKFLDRWHERALGSGVLRTQIANLIARIVLTLTDEVLSGARMDLWSAQAGGPRMLAGLEYRTKPSEEVSSKRKRNA